MQLYVKFDIPSTVNAVERVRLSKERAVGSTQQLLARDRRAVAQGAQLGPGWMDAASQAAVGAGDDVILADDFSERST